MAGVLRMLGLAAIVVLTGIVIWLTVSEVSASANLRAAQRSLDSANAQLKATQHDTQATKDNVMTTRDRYTLGQQVAAYASAFYGERPSAASTVTVCVGSGSCRAIVDKELADIAAFRALLAGLKVPSPIQDADNRVRAGLDMIMEGLNKERSSSDQAPGAKQVIDGIAEVDKGAQLLDTEAWDALQ
jgi:environmental stress-induced protein Ves